MHWWGGQVSSQYDLSLCVCIYLCASVLSEAEANIKKLGDCVQPHNTIRLSRLHTNLINLRETNVTNNVSTITHTDTPL